MKNIRRPTSLVAGLLLFLLGVILSGLSTSHSAPPPDKDVKVINTTSEPVPVIAQGTTTVAGMLQSQQKGDWNVGIVGTPTVQVDSDNANPVYVRDVDNPARQPFQQEVELTLDPGAGGENVAINVPAGKLFVIEQVSASGFAPAGQKMLFSVMTHIAPDLVTRKHLLQTTNSDFGASNFFMASQSVRIYADTPAVLARAERDFTTGTATARFVVSGYFVNK
ncbi:MAG TPA: hypothetical protein VID27_00030 [Blastocatellia bacterium]